MRGRASRAARALPFALACAWVVALALPASAAFADVKALVGGRLVDGTGGPPIEDSVVIVENDRIREIGRVGQLPVPENAQVISTEGMTVLPGLIDLQVRGMRLGHGNVSRWDETYVPLAERVVMPAAARLLLNAGVTTARDASSPLDAALTVRGRIREQRIPGPTLRVSGPTLERDPPPSARAYRWAVAGPEDAKQKVERLVRAGVDYVLVGAVSRLEPAELTAIVTTAKSNGVPVWAEIRRDDDVALALEAGVDGLLGLGTGAQPTWPAAALDALRARAARGAPVPWTLGASALTNYEWLLASREPLDDARWREGLPPIVVADLTASLANPSAITWYEFSATRRPLLGARIRELRAAGAKLLVGSDAGVPAHIPSRATWQEIETLVREGGLSPMEAIVAATSEAAALLGVQHETGTLTPGKYADLIVVRGDPLRHVERLQDLEVVMRRGLRVR